MASAQNDIIHKELGVKLNYIPYFWTSATFSPPIGTPYIEYTINEPS